MLQRGNVLNWLQSEMFRKAALQSCAQKSLDSLSRSAVTAASTIYYTSDTPVSRPQRDRYHDYLLPQFRGLLVDAAGTLLQPSEPAAEVYQRYASKYGLRLTGKQILERYRSAYSKPWAGSSIRYVQDGRPFWRFIVAESTGSTNQDLFEDLYEYYATGAAWKVSPGAVESLNRIRIHLNIKTAVVSNFDTRLRRIMNDLGLTDLFDAIIISAEVGVEKPNPILFELACSELGIKPEVAIHLGDDRRNDVYGARDAGCYSWLFGADVHNFAEVERRLETQNYFDSLHDI